MNSGIYEIVNLTSGRRYIGSTARLSVRFLQHRSKLRQGTHDNPALQAAWSLYGEAAFEYRVLAHVEREHLLVAEQAAFDAALASGERTYNLAPYASSGAKGRVPSDETRAKQSASVKATYAARSPEAVAQHRATLKAGWTPERRAAYAAKRKALWEALSDERKAEIKAARRTGANKPEAMARQLAGTRALFQDPEFLARQRVTSAEAARRPETRAKQAANLARRNKERWADPEYAAKMQASIQASAGSEEGRKRRSDSIKARWADPVKAEKLRAALQAGMDKKKAKKAAG